MIYLASDIHGHIRLEWLKTQLNKLSLSDSDYLIILGDAGMIWSRTEHLEVRAYYECLPCKTLFLDGNHENFDLIYEYPIKDFCGGSVHQISEKLYHLMRGEIYSIDGNTFFVFGGGFSVKKLTGSSPVCVWEQEMPTEKEYENGIRNLDKVGYQVDYVLTHVAPTNISENISVKLVQEEKIINDYLQTISKKTNYKKWYFGHYHKDIRTGSFVGVFESVLRLGE
mgnify:FL=1